MAGRPKGVPNKTTAEAKAILTEAVDRMGGADRLIAWAKEGAANERIFWGQIFPKLLPLQHTGEDGKPIEFRTIYEAAPPK